MTGTCGAALASLALCAGAQDETPETRGTIVVNVTGSNIKRAETEGALPLQVITRSEIQSGGIQTAQELLERISANQSFGSINEAQGIGNTLTGMTAPSLRGLGAERTLVLLNGRRLAPYALSGGAAVDLSGIPMSAIDRVEVLKDGASAIYGTDAIGGVINFILRKDFTGVEAEGTYLGTQHGGGDNWRANAAAGVGDLARDKYNFFISADYFRQYALRGTDREFSRTGYRPSLGIDRTSGASLPANIAQFNPVSGDAWGFRGVRNPTIPYPAGATSASCLPPLSFPMRLAPFQCGFDVPAVIDTIPDAEKTNVIARFTGQLGRDDQLFAEATYYRGRFTHRISPTPVIGPFAEDAAGVDFTLPPTSPFYPGAYVASLIGGRPDLPLELFYRLVDLGARTDESTSQQWTAVLGLQGSRYGWDYELSGNWVRDRQRTYLTSGYVDAGRFGPLLHSGIVDPFGYNSEAVVRLMRATQIVAPYGDDRASNYGADFKASRSVLTLPAGPLTVAFGLEGRRESLEQTSSDLAAAGQIVSFGGAIPTIPAVPRTVWAAFGEVNMPLTRTLEANVAARYDHYSDFGGTTNPKVTLRWQPSRSLVFRGAYGTGFRAPTLYDLYQPHVNDLTENSDPLRCPVTQSELDCDTFFRTHVGGNPQLQPERSHQYSAGVVVEPAAGLSASIDYYHVEIRNVIFYVDDATIWRNFDLLAPVRVIRHPPDAEFPGLPGRIDYIVVSPGNLGELRTAGIDVDARYRAPAISAGQFTLALAGTYVTDYRLTGFGTDAFPTGPGQRGSRGAISRWRHYATLDWNRESWGATLANTFQLGYSEPCPLGEDGHSLDASGCLTRRVGSYSIWDLQARYSGFRDLTLTLGVRNLLDSPPPLSNQGDTFQSGFDPTYADPRGRMLYGAIRYAFR
ncbi:MAG TPA: TonB-dependent receptor [Casimicrobiaceae bacterium]